MAGGLVSFVEPLAAGSGIPEVKTYLNGLHIKGLLTIRWGGGAAVAVHAWDGGMKCSGTPGRKEKDMYPRVMTRS